MISYNMTEEHSYGNTGLATQTVKNAAAVIPEEDLDKICSTGIKIIMVIGLVVLGIVLKECPSPTWLL